METAQVVDRLRTVLSASVLGDRGGEVAGDVPFGHEGVGLDSLALVHLLTRIEKEFDVELPYDMWADASRLSLDDCAAAITRVRTPGGPPG
ncbi:MAG: acyl carrier protein [Actinomycetales bacterium]|nr:acyl carrier protein [Actinomycetales bacterium]